MSKALNGAKDILEKGGTTLIACECREGMGGPEFCGIIRSAGSPREFFETYSDPENFVIDQWGAQNIYQVLDHAGNVYAYSPGLSREDLEQVGATKIGNIQKTVHGLLSRHEKVIVIPDSPYVVGMINGKI
jgi:nickel-dependent lactate racemase